MAIQHSLIGGKIVARPARQLNPRAQREKLAELSRTLQLLIDSDGQRRIVRPAVVSALQVLRDAIRLAAPIDRGRARAVRKKFARKLSKLPLHMILSAKEPSLSGRLRRSIGWSFKKNRRLNATEAKAGINVGKRPSKNPRSYAPHGHLVTLGTKMRIRNKKGIGGVFRWMESQGLGTRLKRRTGRVRPNRFVRRASRNAAPRAMAAARAKAKEKIEQTLQRTGKFNVRNATVINVVYSV